jgi:DNA-directed RNA polymerase alpha subunit
MKTSNSLLPDLPPLKREGNTIYFPGAWPREPPKAPEQRKLSFSEHREGFKDVTFGSYYHTRIMWTLYDLDIRSLEDLVRTPVNELLKHRNIGCKTIECIRAVLESRGFVLGKDWNTVTGVERHEG